MSLNRRSSQTNRWSSMRSRAKPRPSSRSRRRSRMTCRFPCLPSLSRWSSSPNPRWNLWSTFHPLLLLRPRLLRWKQPSLMKSRRPPKLSRPSRSNPSRRLPRRSRRKPVVAVAQPASNPIRRPEPIRHEPLPEMRVERESFSDAWERHKRTMDAARYDEPEPTADATPATPAVEDEIEEQPAMRNPFARRKLTPAPDAPEVEPSSSRRSRNRRSAKSASTAPPKC